MLASLGLALASVAAACPTNGLAAVECEQQQLFERLAPSVVFISNGSGFGSGFFVSDDGLILTNAHVVGTATRVNVVLHSGERAVGDVIERGADNIDVALVKVTAHGHPVELGSLGQVKVGSWLGAIGHGEGAVWTFNSGMLSNIYPQGADRPVFQTQIPLNPGNSGGPIFDLHGHVVGVVTAKVTEASDLNFGIAIDVAERSLPRLAEVAGVLVVTAPAGVPVFVDGTMVGTGPRVAVPVSAQSEHVVFAVVRGKKIERTVVYPTTRQLELK